LRGACVVAHADTMRLLPCAPLQKKRRAGYGTAAPPLETHAMITSEELLTRLAIAAVLGAVVGFERERLDQPAGLRDHALVCVGSALALMVSSFAFAQALRASGAVLDPSRVAAQVVSGIGFLGAGTIILRRNVVHGLTTAASIWVVAVIGLAVGGGMYLAGAATTIAALLILAAARPLTRRLAAPWRRQLISVIFDRQQTSVEQLQADLASFGATIQRMDVRFGDRRDEHRLDFSTRAMPADHLVRLIDRLQMRPGVHGVQSTVDVTRPLHLPDISNEVTSE
jgi:putative Mg2+ transporter-C (MgtC) family protein